MSEDVRTYAYGGVRNFYLMRDFDGRAASMFAKIGIVPLATFRIPDEYADSAAEDDRRGLSVMYSEKAPWRPVRYSAARGSFPVPDSIPYLDCLVLGMLCVYSCPSADEMRGVFAGEVKRALLVAGCPRARMEELVASASAGLDLSLSIHGCGVY